MALMSIGSAIGNLTKSGIDTWYHTLNRSALTPPNYVFGIAWSILYFMIALSGWLIWKLDSRSNLQLIKRLYIAQLILNWSWSPLFFGYRLTGVAFFCLVMIVVLVAILIVKLRKTSTAASVLLMPYLLWLLFAGHLNFYIWWYN